MTDRFRIALAQLNPVMGDIAGNLERARAARAPAARDADLILFSELFIVGYPPEDLVLKPALQDDARAAIEELGARHRRRRPGRADRRALGGGRQALQRLLLLDGGKIAGKTFKVDLPNYGVFDEKRVFAPGPLPGPFNIRGVRSACRSARTSGRRRSPTAWPRPARRFCCVPNGSPFEAGKEDVRLKLAAARVTETGLPLIYLNQVGGQDELVFDGARFVLNADGSLRAGAAGLGGEASSSPTGRATRTANGSARRATRAREEDRSHPRSITP